MVDQDLQFRNCLIKKSSYKLKSEKKDLNLVSNYLIDNQVNFCYFLS
jgi:hypothetical protein